MLSLITFKESDDYIEICADEKGIGELIQYLNYIRRNKDHIHLTIDTELNDYPIPLDRKEKVRIIRSVRLEYNPTENWSIDYK
jgi:hypothetical protein